VEATTAGSGDANNYKGNDTDISAVINSKPKTDCSQSAHRAENASHYKHFHNMTKAIDIKLS